jgi:hypothetical protein
MATRGATIVKTVLTPRSESVLKTSRETDLAWVNFIPRAILGFGVLFSGLGRFQFGFPQYAKSVGGNPLRREVSFSTHPGWTCNGCALR